MGPATSESNGKADDAEQTAANAIAIKNGKTEKEEAFLVTETMPLFPTDDPVVPYGDLGNFRAWVQKNVKYPAEAFEKGIGGRVVLSFVVEKDGSVSDIQKLQAPDASLWEEARRVIASSPKWKPGEQRGQIPSQAPADRHPLLIFKPPAGRPQKLPRLSQATEPTISGNGVHPEFSGRRFYRPAGPPNSDTCETAPAAPDFSALSPNGSATPPLRITPCNSERYSRMPHRISKKTAAGAVCPY